MLNKPRRVSLLVSKTQLAGCLSLLVPKNINLHSRWNVVHYLSLLSSQGLGISQNLKGNQLNLENSEPKPIYISKSVPLEWDPVTMCNMSFMTLSMRGECVTVPD